MINELDITTSYINKNVVSFFSKTMRCEVLIKPADIGRTIGELVTEWLEHPDIPPGGLAMRYMPDPAERTVSAAEAERIHLWASRNGRPIYKRYYSFGRDKMIVTLSAKDWDLYEIS